MTTRIIIILLACSTWLHSQPFSPARRYLSKITRALSEVERHRHAYANAFITYADPVEIEKTRRLLLKSTAETVRKVAKMKPYRGAYYLRDSMLIYLGFTYASVGEDFVSVADMDAIAELSHDAMESYLNARESAYRGLDFAAGSLNAAIRRYAETNRIKLKEVEDRSEIRNAVARYNEVYDIYFRCHKQEQYVLEAIRHEDIAAVEQNRKALMKTSRESLWRLQTLRNGKAETPLEARCRQMLEFYYFEAKELSDAAAFIGETDYFARLKRAFLAAAPEDHSGEKLQTLFRAVSTLSEKGSAIESTMQTLSSQRAMLTAQWNQQCREYLAGAGEP